MNQDCSMGHRSNLANSMISNDKPSNVIEHPSLRVAIDDDNDGQGNHYDCEKTWPEAKNRSGCGTTRVNQHCSTFLQCIQSSM